MKNRGLSGIGVVTGMILAGCGGEGEKEWAWPELGQVEALEEIREVPEAIWERRAISYSGYREGQDLDGGPHPTDAEVLEDLGIISEAGFGLLRVYDSRRHGGQVVEVIAREGLDLKVQLGAYLTGPHEEEGEANVGELEAAIELANRYPEVVMAVSVGNETLVSWSFVPVPPEQMVGYIDYVRERIEQPVTVNDNWEPYAAEFGDPVQQVWGRIDYASVHTYAYWDAGFRLWSFRQEEVPEADRPAAQVAAAVAYAEKNFDAVRAALDAGGVDIPIVIGETGWQSVASAYLDDAYEKDFAEVLAGEARQALYYEAMQRWAYGVSGDNPGDGHERPAAMFYFAAFDEPWKERDDNWGLWDVGREPKPAAP